MAYCEVAALFTLPLIRKPSLDWESVAGGAGAAASVEPAPLAPAPFAGAAAPLAPDAPGAPAAPGADGSVVAAAICTGALASTLIGLVAMRICSSESSLISIAATGPPGGMVTSCAAAAKPVIATAMLHLPSARSGNEYRPWSSVIEDSFLSPCVAVTVAPGTGRLLKVTWP